MDLAGNQEISCETDVLVYQDYGQLQIDNYITYIAICDYYKLKLWSYITSFIISTVWYL